MNTTYDNSDEYMTVEEVAAILRVHPATVRDLIQAGELAAIRVRKRGIRISRSDFEAYKERARVKRQESEE